MMTSVAQIESAIEELSTDEQLQLIERLAQRIRGKPRRRLKVTDAEIAEMASDPDIRREIAQIDKEFRVTEMDGLSDTI